MNDSGSMYYTQGRNFYIILITVLHNKHTHTISDARDDGVEQTILLRDEMWVKI